MEKGSGAPLSIQATAEVWFAVLECEVVNEQKLSAVLSEFARTLTTDFPIQGILDHLVERVVDLLPVSAAGVTFIANGIAPHFIAASDDSALRFERLQTEIAHGPCLSAFETGQIVAVPDLDVDGRFPLFSPVAVAEGMAAVFTFPLRHGNGPLGALDLYTRTPGELDPHDMEVAQTLADVAAAYLLNAQTRAEARATSDRFHHSALHDPLTGLPNRLLLQERLEAAAQRAKRMHSNAAVLFVDLDRFKRVNDTHGHQVGDELLLAVARRLSSLVRVGDTLARYSGDEFVFLCEDLASVADVEGLARRIDDSLAAPFVLPSTECTVTASVGIAFAGPGETISNELIVKADMAMYQVKRERGGGHRIVDMRAALRTNDSALHVDLRGALANDELQLAYQPIVQTADGRLTSVEALLRWTHPARGPVPPMSIVTVAERSGLINEIGAWILKRACRDWSFWAAQHADLALDLAVNVSARELVQPGFLDSVSDVLTTTGMDPRALVLEITENVFIEDGNRVMTVLTGLKDLGIRLALDDFGSGYSSLSYLARLPIDVVKIDNGFTADIGGAPGRAIVAAVTDLAHVLGLTVVAEGVETKSQHEEVNAMGCDRGQGYFYARPMSATAFETVLDDYRFDLAAPPVTRGGGVEVFATALRNAAQMTGGSHPALERPRAIS